MDFETLTSSYSIGEWTAVLTAIAYVILASKGSKWCFVFGFISSLIYIAISLRLKYYYDVSINAYYVAMSIVGWIKWEKKTHEIPEEKYHFFTPKNAFMWMSIGMIGTILLGLIAYNYTDASLPFADAFTTIYALIATWLIIKKVVEAWLIWIIVDALAAWMYFVKDLPLTAFLFIIYTIIAVFGYFSWKKKVK